VENDDGGEGSSTVATTPPAPEGATPSEITKDTGEVVEQDENQEAGETQALPETIEAEVSLSFI